ncbi:hypothetical protein HMPREF0673_02013 [Leyella stercorea DSM 18206]|uniref:Uncharacterized protein n=1 Tax=Leyella stercorea DSM 18206 TaxID=1002367 RepID=G6AZE9_9BACT|nr:hypothetical protein HMPREF0673_02013 [Leyella stercorea DSM 18206]
MPPLKTPFEVYRHKVLLLRSFPKSVYPIIYRIKADFELFIVK